MRKIERLKKDGRLTRAELINCSRTGSRCDELPEPFEAMFDIPGFKKGTRSFLKIPKIDKLTF